MKTSWDFRVFDIFANQRRALTWVVPKPSPPGFEGYQGWSSSAPRLPEVGNCEGSVRWANLLTGFWSSKITSKPFSIYLPEVTPCCMLSLLFCNYSPTLRSLREESSWSSREIIFGISSNWTLTSLNIKVVNNIFPFYPFSVLSTSLWNWKEMKKGIVLTLAPL